MIVGIDFLKKGLIEGLQVDEISGTWVAVSSFRRELAHFSSFSGMFCC